MASTGGVIRKPRECPRSAHTRCRFRETMVFSRDFWTFVPEDLTPPSRSPELPHLRSSGPHGTLEVLSPLPSPLPPAWRPCGSGCPRNGHESLPEAHAVLNLLGYMLNQPFADHSDGVRAVLPSGLRHAHPRRREEYSGTRAFVSLAPALASHTHTHSDTPFCIRLHGGGLGASENPIRDLSAARRGGARSGGHLFGIRKDPISSSNGATSSCVWCAPPGRRERGPTPLHPGGPPLGVQALRHLRRVESRCAA